MAQSTASVEAAIDWFRAGKPVLIHDFHDREDETDFVYPAGSVTPADVARLRNDAGGLVCVALDNDCANSFDLPYLHEIIQHPAARNPDLDYDHRPSFSLPVNHRRTRTGIPDVDRSQTIQALARAAEDPPATGFSDEFRTPGHVNLLKAAPSLRDRRGHTELGIAMADAADLPPAVVLCEMLEDGGGSLDSDDARAYADHTGLPFLVGDELIEVFEY